MDTINRRSFLAGAAALAATVPVVAFADESSDASADASAKPDASTAPASAFMSDDMQTYCDMGGTSLTLEELNKIRRELVDAAGDLELEDGTVVPAVWNKLNVLTNTYGGGGTDPKTGEGVKYLQMMFDNDEELAQEYIDAPWGVVFSANEYAQQTGRDLEESKAILDDLASRGLMYRNYRSGMMFYQQLPYVHGFFELSIKRMWDPDYIGTLYQDYLGAPSGHGKLVEAGTPIYYSVPVGEEVVSDARVAPLNDWRDMVERWDKIALVPCVCSLRQNAFLNNCDVPEMGTPEFSEYHNTYGSGHKLERCLAFGEEAEYYLENGLGREITKDECYQVIQDNIDAGLVIQFGYVRNGNIICSCHSDCCGVLGTYRAMDDETWAASPIQKTLSDYTLEYDKDTCLQCGACVERCPMVAITMDDDGYPTVDDRCVRCGQCGLVCPAEARKLSHKPAEECLPVPEDHMADHNRKFGYRVEHGLVELPA